MELLDVDIGDEEKFIDIEDNESQSGVTEVDNVENENEPDS